MQGPIHEGNGILFADLSAAVQAVRATDAGKEHAEVVYNFRLCTYGTSRVDDVITLLQCNGGGNILNRFHFGLRHFLEKLSSIGRETFDIASLSFRVQSVEDQGALATSGEARDHGEFPGGEVGRDVLEIVLSDPDQADRGFLRRGLHRGIKPGSRVDIHRVFYCRIKGLAAFSFPSRHAA